MVKTAFMDIQQQQKIADKIADRVNSLRPDLQTDVDTAKYKRGAPEQKRSSETVKKQSTNIQNAVNKSINEYINSKDMGAFQTSLNDLNIDFKNIIDVIEKVADKDNISESDITFKIDMNDVANGENKYQGEILSALTNIEGYGRESYELQQLEIDNTKLQARREAVQTAREQVSGVTSNTGVNTFARAALDSTGLGAAFGAVDEMFGVSDMVGEKLNEILDEEEMKISAEEEALTKEKELMVQAMTEINSPTSSEGIVEDSGNEVLVNKLNDLESLTEDSLDLQSQTLETTKDSNKKSGDSEIEKAIKEEADRKLQHQMADSLEEMANKDPIIILPEEDVKEEEEGFFSKLFKKIGGFFIAPMAAIMSFITPMITAVKTFFSGFKGLMRGFVLLTALIGGFIGFFDTTKIFGKDATLGEYLASTLAGILSAFTFGLVDIKDLALGLGDMFNEVGDVFGGVWDEIMGIVDSIMSIFTSASDDTESSMNGLKKLLLGITTFIGNTIGLLLKGVGYVFKGVFKVIGVIVNVVAAVLKPIFKILNVVGTAIFGILNGVMAVVSPLIGAIEGIFSFMFGWFSSLIDMLTAPFMFFVDILSSAFNALIDTIMAPFNWFANGMEGGLGGLIDLLIAPFTNFFDSVGDAFGSLIDSLLAPFNFIVDSVSSLFSGFMDAISTPFNWISDVISAYFSWWWDTFTAPFKWIGNLLGEFFTNFADSFMAPFNWIGNMISSYLSWWWDTFTAPFNWISDKITGFFNWFGDMFDTVMGMIDKVLHPLDSVSDAIGDGVDAAKDKAAELAFDIGQKAEYAANAVNPFGEDGDVLEARQIEEKKVFMANQAKEKETRIVAKKKEKTNKEKPIVKGDNSSDDFYIDQQIKQAEYSPGGTLIERENAKINKFKGVTDNGPSSKDLYDKHIKRNESNKAPVSKGAFTPAPLTEKTSSTTNSSDHLVEKKIDYIQQALDTNKAVAAKNIHQNEVKVPDSKAQKAQAKNVQVIAKKDKTPKVDVNDPLAKSRQPGPQSGRSIRMNPDVKNSFPAGKTSVGDADLLVLGSVFLNK